MPSEGKRHCLMSLGEREGFKKEVEPVKGKESGYRLTSPEEEIF